MASAIPMVLQTAYAELMDRAGSAAFEDAFPDDGVFVAKTVRGRRYWYFQLPAGSGRQQRYVGPETPELMERVAHHREARGDHNDRSALVSMLVRSAYLPRPLPRIGDIVAALAKAGVFRLRGVLVGTVAYHTYPAMLGTRLPIASLQTGDIDIAQFSDVSIAVEDSTPVMLDVLREVDPSFRPISSVADDRRVTTYEATSGIRVDFLTPNRGPEKRSPEALPALGTDAQPLRFLDFLIRDPEPAVLLHGTGIYVLVPAPQRYAVHKLIVARRRPAGNVKRGKDIQQAEALFDVLISKRPHELRAAWREAWARGKTWRQLLGEALGLVSTEARDRILKAVDATRSIIPGLDLRFSAPPARYDFDRDVVTFYGESGDARVRCSVSREALDDHFGADGLGKDGRVMKFRQNRETFETMLRIKYLAWPVEEPGAVLIKTGDVEKLLERI